MLKRPGFEELLDSFYRHIESEIGLEHIKTSLTPEISHLQKAHDAIHEFILLAPLLSAHSSSTETDWLRKSAFLVYQWEAFHHAHRSLFEVLCGYYNVAFVLLRVTFELLIKGAFWECLSHKKFREHSQALEEDKAGRKLKGWLKEVCESDPDLEEKFEQVSASIYDKIGTSLGNSQFLPSIRTILRQLDQWGILNPLSEAEVYSEVYRRLSADVHVTPEKTDIGRRLVDETSEIFEQQLLPETLREYTGLLHSVMDLAIVIELNIMEDATEQYEEARLNLRARLGTLKRLKLRHSLTRAKELLG